jgi:hypothetical protein
MYMRNFADFTFHFHGVLWCFMIMYDYDAFISAIIHGFLAVSASDAPYKHNFAIYFSSFCCYLRERGS